MDVCLTALLTFAAFVPDEYGIKDRLTFESQNLAPTPIYEMKTCGPPS